MKLRIENIQPIKGLMRWDLFKILKASFNFEHFEDIKELVDKMTSSYSAEVEEEDIPKLQNAFTFHCQTLADKQREIEQQNYYKEREEKMIAARNWYNTLSPELQEHVQVLQNSLIVTG